jgi:hypothetical protein
MIMRRVLATIAEQWELEPPYPYRRALREAA